MMNIPLKNRRKIHISLFISFIIVLLILINLIIKLRNDEHNLNDFFKDSTKSNKSLLYTNLATSNYFKSDMYFNKYFHTNNVKYLQSYKSTIDTMTLYIDSLNNLKTNNPVLNVPFEDKQKSSIELLNLKLNLDSLINLGIKPLKVDELKFLKLQNYDSEAVLSSLKYDTLKKTDKKEKKNFFNRIAKAISGKENTQKEETKIYISLLYGGIRNSGTIEEQLKNIFERTDLHYNKEFEKIKIIYLKLNETNDKLLIINNKIINNCQKTILFYNKLNISKNNFDFNRQKNEVISLRSLIYKLLVLLLFLTILILVYQFFAFKYEKDLIQTKTELEKNLDFKNQIIGMLSHEIRAPINIISAASNKIKNNYKNQELEETVNNLNFTSNSLQITVNQILNFIKSENSKLVLYKSNLNLLEEINSITSSIQSLIDAKKLKLIKKINPNLNVNVWADNGKIHQLFYNIIGNAIKFTDKGSISLICDIEKLNNIIKFNVTIKDTGIGIPKEDLLHIFDKFYQSNASNGKISLGAGLGLNLCKEIIELHQGEISVISNENHGTEISFYIILEQENDINQTNKTKLIQLLKNRPIKIAFVDDDILITTIIKKMIADVGIEIEVFSTANQILKFLKKNEVDLVITDLEISGFSGKVLTKNIKSLTNKNSQIPIMAITGDNYMATIDIESIGMNEILIKPVEQEEFYSKLITLFKK